MGKKDPRVDAYIAQAAEFARPILTEIRQRVHAACPEAVETLKWKMPTFMHHGLLCGMAAFKNHAAFSFWKGSLILDGTGSRADEAMGQFGRLTTVSDLPAKRVFAGYVKKAMELNEAGVKVMRVRTTPRPRLKPPPPFQAALGKNRKALTHWSAFSPSMQREYIEWITEAKRDDTRDRRIATAVAWIAEGKSRNWKYMNC